MECYVCLIVFSKLVLIFVLSCSFGTEAQCRRRHFIINIKGWNIILWGLRCKGRQGLAYNLLGWESDVPLMASHHPPPKIQKAHETQVAHNFDNDAKVAPV